MAQTTTAAAVIEAGQQVVASGGFRLGDKVRLADVADALGVELASIAAELIAWNRADAIQLYRADLPLDPAREAASELRYGCATFHYLRVPGVRAW